MNRARARLLPALLVLSSLVARGAEAQREVQRHDFDSSEGRLLGFYSASLLFTPIALVGPGTPRRVTVGVELGFVPRLTSEQRAIGNDKPENTNLAPVFPRPRVAVALPAGVTAEVSWLPPIRVFGVKANLVNAALSASLGSLGGVGVRGRLAAPWGTVQGAITCSRDVVAEGDADLQRYFEIICNGNESEDEFRPRHVSLELVGTGLRARQFVGGSWVPWATLGVRREWTRFDIGVLDDEGNRDLDHPILELRGTRPHGAIGIAWTGVKGATLAAEGFYAPGSLATARVYAGIRR